MTLDITSHNVFVHIDASVDTGGLNLKSTGGRAMKGDMAGSAATLGAFMFWAKYSAAVPEKAFPAPLYAACVSLSRK